MKEQDLTYGHVARYCKPSALDEQGTPTSAAFQRRLNEEYLSVYWLEYFHQASEKARIHAVKQTMEQQQFQLKPRGLFAVLDIEQSTQYVFAEIAEHIVYRAMNLPHCGLLHESDDLLIAELLAECIRANYAVKDITDD